MKLFANSSATHQRAGCPSLIGQQSNRCIGQAIGGLATGSRRNSFSSPHCGIGLPFCLALDLGVHDVADRRVELGARIELGVGVILDRDVHQVLAAGAILGEVRRGDRTENAREGEARLDFIRRSGERQAFRHVLRSALGHVLETAHQDDVVKPAATANTLRGGELEAQGALAAATATTPIASNMIRRSACGTKFIEAEVGASMSFGSFLDKEAPALR